jgi:hypothetical protein
VYATFVILTGSVHATCAFQLGLPLVEWTDPVRLYVCIVEIGIEFHE